jgi:energy-coupling factor transporter ATP-binding protein EcfA2
MLAISRALLMNPRLLIMDEPTEGLAPVIVAHVEEMLVALAEAGDVAILVIEQKHRRRDRDVDPVAIMVNGRINRIIASATLAGDRDLQQRLLGVGRHGHDERTGWRNHHRRSPDAAASRDGPTRVYMSNPALPTRWSQPVPPPHRGPGGTISRPVLATLDGRRVSGTGPLANNLVGEPAIIVAGTLDTKGDELRYMRDIIREEGLRTRLVDLSTSGRSAGADVSPQEVALAHPARLRRARVRRPRHGGRGHDGSLPGVARPPAGRARRHLGWAGPGTPRWRPPACRRCPSASRR